MTPQEQHEHKVAMLRANGLHIQAAQLEKRWLEQQLKPQTMPELPRTIPTEPKVDWLGRFVTQDPDLLKTKSMCLKLIPHPDPVLIQGPTGTGKELLARSLHGSRPGSFIAINCAGLPEHLIESELFGHAKGSFTGSISEKVGLFQAAENGTIFLDEIGDLPLGLQAKLLRVIQFKSVRRVGSNREESINCRIVAATHWDLETRVAEGLFRLDLYHRLAVFKLVTKSLADRPADLPLLIKRLAPLDPEIHELDWASLTYPGNIRTLEAYIRRYQVLGREALDI